MKTIQFTPQGVCSKNIAITVEGTIVRKIAFTAGCNGNLQAVSALAEGMDAAVLIGKLKGIQCGAKGTSCPDQLSKALEQLLAEE